MSKLRMKKILQINTVGNCGSTGRIAEQIGIAAQNAGFESFIACGRRIRPSRSQIIKIGSEWHTYPNVAWTRIFDSDSPLAKISTLKFIEKICEISPDIIHLHNLHGYYLHVPTLLKFLGEYNRPTLWTLHDCWPITGHCCYYDFIQCEKWKTICGNCPQKKEYPTSLVFDRSRKNHEEKIGLISKIQNLTFVAVSQWLASIVKQSRVGDKNIVVIRNGIDLNTFYPMQNSEQDPSHKRKKGLFVASDWAKRKGFFLIPEIAKNLENIDCTVVGVTEKQREFLRQYGIKAITKTESTAELRDLYSNADVFINPTLEEALSMVNIEATACGTAVVTFDSGGTSETVGDGTGIVVERGDISALCRAAEKIARKKSPQTIEKCVSYAEENFSAQNSFQKYVDLYKNTINRAPSE